MGIAQRVWEGVLGGGETAKLITVIQQDKTTIVHMRLPVPDKCAFVQDRRCAQGDHCQQRKDGCEGAEVTPHHIR